MSVNIGCTGQVRAFARTFGEAAPTADASRVSGVGSVRQNLMLEVNLPLAKHRKER